MKNKVKSKVLIFMLCLILSGMAMLGCSNGSEEGDVPELASVSFGFMEGGEKVIGISREALSNDDLYWSYTAEWKGDAGVTPEGAQSEKKAVKDGAGLAELGGFTPGSWEFGLFGYSDSERTKLVLSGTSGTAVLSAGSKAQVDVVVDYSTTGTGTIKLGEITFKEGTGYTLVSITVDGGTEQITNLSDSQLTGIAAGSHTVYLKYSGTGGYYEAKVLVAVSAGITTVIEGQLDLLVAAAPTGLAGVKPSYYGQTDGKITGVSSTMEYSKDGGTNWIPVTGTEITGLAAGEYKVRVSGGARPGTAVDVTVPEGDFRITLCAGEGSGDDTYEYVAAGTDNFTSACPSTFTAPAFTPKTGAVPATHENFIGLNTKADGSGTAYAAGVKATISDNTTLYAQWAKPSFSVSADKKVYFAKGNLWATYNGTYSWGFAENQYDYIGNTAGNITIASQATGAKVDLFGWSTAATDYGINNSTNNSSYSGNFVDWGCIESLPGNSGTPKVWSTLSSAEWTYLLNTRDNASDLKKCGVTVCGKANCVIIAPDNFSGEIKDSYDTTAWSAAEAAGLVCLPVAGNRSGSGVSNVGSIGNYWSATPYDVDLANYLSFNSSYVDVIYYDRFNGFSVRLVVDEN